MDLEKAVVVKTFLKLNDADLAAAQLRSAGIECTISADDAGGLYPPLALIKLFVDPSDAEDARRILDEAVPPDTVLEVGIPWQTSHVLRPHFPPGLSLWLAFSLGLLPMACMVKIVAGTGLPGSQIKHTVVQRPTNQRPTGAEPLSNGSTTKTTMDGRTNGFPMTGAC